MDEKRNLLDTLAEIATFGFCVLGLFVVGGAFFYRRRENDFTPEYIVTSSGRKLFLTVESEKDNVYEFQVVPPRRVGRSQPASEMDTIETRRADEPNPA